MIEASLSDNRRQQSLRAAVAIYFVLFISVILPLHALVCEPTGSTHKYTLFGTDNAIRQPVHDPELCQVCRGHGQLDLLFHQADISIVAVDPAPEAIVDQRASNRSAIYLPLRRAPPSCS